MSLKDSMSSALQENVLTLLCFSEDAAKIICGYVTADLFESAVFQEIAQQALTFLDSYKKPVADHLPDVLENVMGKADARKRELYEKTLVNLYACKDTINEEYTLSSLNVFIRQQRLKQSLTQAVKNVQEGDLDAAEEEMSSHLKSTLEVFDLGLSFKDIPKRFAHIFGDTAKAFQTGIEPFDKRNIGPNRKELFTILALPNKGKSWMLLHLAKMGLLQRLKVLYITLEMSQDKIAGRFLQNLFSVTKRKGEILIPSFKRDALGRFMDLDYLKANRPSMEDSDVESMLIKKLGLHENRLKFIIKQFPTSHLNTRGLESYLDSLERHTGFVPDLICLDYADLMSIDTANLRLDTGRLYKELRGIAVERNLALATASQSNRVGNKDKWITMENFAEDFSKAGISDIVVSYNQTDVEYKMNLARLLACKVRDDEKDVAALVSQMYSAGQFCLDSIEMEDNYWKLVKPKGGKDEERDEE